MKIAIVTKNWLGDTLFQIPAIEVIRERFPQAEIVCIAPERCRAILECHPAVSRMIVFDEKKEHRSWLSRLRFAWQMRREKLDQVYFFHRSRTRAFLMYLAAAKERLGYGRGRRLFLTKAIPEPESNMHQVDYFMNLLKGLGFRTAFHPVYHFYPKQVHQEAIEARLAVLGVSPKRFVCFHLGANWEPKRWPVERFAELADLLEERWHLPVVITGAEQDLPLADEMMRSVKKAKVENLVGKTQLGEVGALYNLSALVVSGDSGPMHIASAVGTRLVALFGPTDPALTGPRGTGKRIVLRHIPEGFRTPWYEDRLPAKPWLSGILADEVMREIENKGWLENLPQEEHGRRQKIGESRWVRKSDGSKNPKRILVVTLNNIGDVILNTPVITALQARFPSADITAVTGPRGVDILRGSALIHRLIIYDKKAGLKAKWRFVKKLRKARYDWVVDLRNTAIPFLVSSKKRSPVLRNHRKELMRDRHLEVLTWMGIEPELGGVFDFFHERDRVTLLEKLNHLGINQQNDWILISPVARSELKTWRLEGFREVITRLLSYSDKKILLVGDERERPMIEPLIGLNPERVFNLAGKTSLKELACLVSESALLLSNDSAVMHFAFEYNRPVVAIFGPTDQRKYGREGKHVVIVREAVECQPCGQPRCRFDRQACFEDLSPDKVVEACLSFLKSVPEASSVGQGS